MSSSSQDEEPYIALTLPALRSLIFGENGDLTCPTTRPQSLTPSDLAKVIVTHLAIGQHIYEQDKAEHYFHIEFFPTHAEIWLATEWQISDAKRKRINAIRQEEQKARLDAQERLALIEDELSVFKTWPEAHKKAVARIINENWTNGSLKDLIKLLDVQLH